jgi:tetratricopeptide (TPR) repeat protein
VLLSGNFASAQKMPEDYFTEAIALNEAGKSEEALAGFQYIVKYCKRNELYSRALFNVAFLYEKLKKHDSALFVYKTIIQSGFDEKEWSGLGIMDNPYAMYAHNSCSNISSIYSELQQYDSALHYFALADTVYPYEHFCGNAYEAYYVYRAVRYAELYGQLKAPDKALGALLQAAFIYSDDSSSVVKELRVLLQDKKGAAKELDEALNHIYSRKHKKGKETNWQYYFDFMGHAVPVPQGFVYSKRKDPFDKKASLEEIKNSAFFKMLHTLY